MSIKIKIYSDYVCPYCYLAEFPLQEAIQGKDVEVEWIPYELRPYPHETLRPEGEYLKTVWRNSVYPLAESMNVPIRLPSISPQPHTRLAFEGSYFAKEHGKGNEYNHRVMEAFFVEDQNIGDIEVLTKVAAGIGLPEAEFREVLKTRRYREIHQQALRHAYDEMDGCGVPTFVISSQVLSGLQDRKRLEAAIAWALEEEGNE